MTPNNGSDESGTTTHLPSEVATPFVSPHQGFRYRAIAKPVAFDDKGIVVTEAATATA